MNDLKNTKAPVSTVTHNKNEFDEKTNNIYEAISIASKRAIQINSEIKKELLEKLEEFATYSDSLEEVFENKEQITLSTLSKNPVLQDFVNEKDGSLSWNNHVELGLWADIFLIAPATANTLSKMANGTCDNLLLATYLSAKCPVYFAPAMDLDMYKHPSTKESFDKLRCKSVFGLWANKFVD